MWFFSNKIKFQYDKRGVNQPFYQNSTCILYCYVFARLGSMHIQFASSRKNVPQSFKFDLEKI